MVKQKLFRRFGSDNLKNGVVAGGIAGALTIYGHKIVEFVYGLEMVSPKILPYIIIGAGMVIGWYVDRI